MLDCRVHILQLDVTDDSQIQDAVSYMSARLGEEGICQFTLCIHLSGILLPYSLRDMQSAK